MNWFFGVVVVAGMLFDGWRGWQRGAREGRLNRLRRVDEAAREQGWVIASIQHRRGKVTGARWESANGEWVVDFEV